MGGTRRGEKSIYLSASTAGRATVAGESLARRLSGARSRVEC
ncbi:hypothetical protein COLO4_26017 [Corchorus olitorius]|uniref:Uncharacterized protein n=1 Tax=Corchorus olitorius TaxID=93759 RepID=A0A1R3HZ13_9ROSI|nr:hypothetical protein COLO4_26017 [Corchorus olitorius]